MKRCSHCYQIYDDDTLFCLADGTHLVSVMDTFSDATVITSAPFPRQFSRSVPANKGVNPLPIYLGIGLLILILAGGFGVWRMLGSSSSETAVREKDLQHREQEIANAEKEKLQNEQDSLAREKQLLEEEKKNLESTKRQQSQNPIVMPQTVSPTSSAGAAIVFAPPSNIRESPNGRILCSVTRKATIKIYGSTSVNDKNGVWIYTDVCGSMGVIHSTQIKY